MSKARLISSIIAISVILVGIFYDWMFITVISLLTIGGLYEFFYLIKKKNIPIYSYTGIFIGVLIPLSIFTRFELTRNWELIFIIVAFLTILVMQFARRDNKNAIVGLATTMFGVLYVSWFFSYLVRIRLMLPGMDGIKLLGFVLLVTKCGDIGALLVGSKIGKHPLLPRVSPNKSIEGSIGSFFCSGLVALACHSFLPSFLSFSMLHTFALGLILGGLGQMGDLSESLIKRDCEVKDSGKFLPGMGGVLDVIDSLLFAAPVFYFYLSARMSAL